MDNKTYLAIKDYLRIIIKDTEFEDNLFAVGGCCRDEILGNDIKDLDLVVSLNNGGIRFAEWLEKNHYTKGTIVTYPRFGTAMFKLKDFPDEELEVVQTRTEIYNSDSRKPDTTFGSLKEDCMRRDLTINAIYYDISNSKMVDVTGRSFDDIKNKIIITPCDPDKTYIDDPLRIMRCIRFSCKLGWDIDKNVFESMKRNVDRLSIISKERIKDELMKIFKSNNTLKGLCYIRDINAMKYIFPNMDMYCGPSCIENWFTNIDTLTDPYVKLAVFNNGNPDLDIQLSDLKFSTNEIRIIINYIDLLCYAIHCNSLSDIREILYICKSKDMFNTVYNICNAIEFKKEYIEYAHNNIDTDESLSIMFNYKFPLNGDDIMNIFNISPSPEVKELIDKMHDFVYENPYITKDELIEKLKIFKETKPDEQW